MKFEFYVENYYREQMLRESVGPRRNLSAKSLAGVQCLHRSVDREGRRRGHPLGRRRPLGRSRIPVPRLRQPLVALLSVEDVQAFRGP